MVIGSHCLRSKSINDCICSVLEGVVCFPTAPRVGQPTYPTPDALGKTSQQISAYALIAHMAAVLQQQRNALEGKPRTTKIQSKIDKLQYLEGQLDLIHRSGKSHISDKDLFCLNILLAHHEDVAKDIEHAAEEHHAPLIMKTQPELYLQSPIWIALEKKEKFLTRKIDYIKQTKVDAADLATAMQDYALFNKFADQAAQPHSEAKEQQILHDIVEEAKSAAIDRAEATGKPVTDAVVEHEYISRTLALREKMRELAEHTKTKAQLLNDYFRKVGSKARKLMAHTECAHAATEQEAVEAEKKASDTTPTTPQEIATEAGALMNRLGAQSGTASLFGLIKQMAEDAQQAHAGHHCTVGKIAEAYNEFAKGMSAHLAETRQKLKAVQEAKKALQLQWSACNENYGRMTDGTLASLMSQAGFTPEESNTLSNKTSEWLNAQSPALTLGAAIGEMFSKLRENPEIKKAQDKLKSKGNSYEA